MFNGDSLVIQSQIILPVSETCEVLNGNSESTSEGLTLDGLNA